ncbi:6-bladed beta-propeller [Parabacteroides chinchillae]|uniref:6-bladed beta-propeller protein n=1 Tax=Parabacteroides chinchillae TaxID=871327 RepID=A0A8G2BYS2_9BACT|nr:6-bladed beta-propeller [Parabacteroides chinchillae]SEG23118.1 6-bladed beta-propeller protein [Parabacteroides chinchillae]
MKTRHFSLLISFFLLGSQVVNSQSKVSNLPVFDFSKDYPQKKMCLQDMADIEYIPLETTDDILLSGAAKLSAVTNKYILVHELQLGDIFLFDRSTGKLYSHFNHKGQSGMEYSWIKNGTILDEKKEEIYVCSQYIQVYSLKGEYKRTLKINGFENDMRILNYDDTSLLIYDEVIIEPGHENKTKKAPYRLMSKKDGSLISILNLEFSKRYSNKIAQHLENNMWRSFVISYSHNMHYGSDIIIADISSDTLYQLSPSKGLIPLLTRTPSIHAHEPRNIWTPFLTTDKFMLIGTFLLDFNPKGGGPIPSFMLDFRTREINKASIWDTEYETKSWRQGRWGGPNGTPAIAKNMAAELIQASSVIDAYKGKRLKGNGEKVAKKLLEDDNPVVRILTFKQ